MPVRPLRPHDPRVLGEYELTGLLGEGGMGAVYQARDPAGQLVAIKVIRPEFATVDEFRARFRSEVSRARQVPPFSTAAVLDADPEHHTPYLVVEYVDGPTLAEVVSRQGPLTGGALQSVAVGVATALVAIHGAGVVHRDLKPANVLFALGSPKVIDFGIARALEMTSAHTRTGQMVGTVAYMAPERLDGPAERANTPAVDIFAWGAVVAYAALGRGPFPGDSSTAVAVKILTAEPDLGGLDGQLAEIVRRTLAKNPTDRPTAEELLTLLLSRSPVPAAGTTAPPPREAPEHEETTVLLGAPGRTNVPSGARAGAGRSPRRRRMAALAAGAAVLVAAAVTTPLIMKADRDDKDPVAAAPASSATPRSASPSWTPPVSLRLAFHDPLISPEAMPEISTKSFTCTYADWGVIITGSNGQCKGPATGYTGDLMIKLYVMLMTKDTCAIVSLRSAPAQDRSWVFSLCDDRMTMSGSAAKDGHDDSVFVRTEVSTGHRVELDVRGDRYSARIDEGQVLSGRLRSGFPDATGPVSLGMSYEGKQTSRSTERVGFSDLEIWNG